MNRKIHVTIFNEHNQDRYEPVLSLYPNGIHDAIADAFRGYDEFEIDRKSTRLNSSHP